MAERASSYAEVYSALEGFRESMNLDITLWANLHVIESAPDQIPDDALLTALSVVGQLRDGTDRTAIIALQQIALLLKIGIVPSHYGTNGGNSQSALIASVRARGICRPLVVDGRPYRQPA